MIYDLRELPPEGRYKLMASTITPRPIGWITSESADGVRNAAPYSFFNMMGADPPVIVLGMMARSEGGLKDSAANILATGDFVVNLVSEADAAAMNLTCVDAPPDIDEIVLAGLAVLPSQVVRAPRIASAPASFECRLAETIRFAGKEQVIVVGEVLIAHIADAYMLDPARCHVDTPAMGLVGRVHGSGWYARMSDVFHMTRPDWASDPARFDGHR